MRMKDTGIFLIFNLKLKNAVLRSLILQRLRWITQGGPDRMITHGNYRD